MANTKTLRLSVGALFTKGPGKIYFYRYQVAFYLTIFISLGRVRRVFPAGRS